MVRKHAGRTIVSMSIIAPRTCPSFLGGAEGRSSSARVHFLYCTILKARARAPRGGRA